MIAVVTSSFCLAITSLCHYTNVTLNMANLQDSYNAFLQGNDALHKSESAVFVTITNHSYYL